MFPLLDRGVKFALSPAPTFKGSLSSPTWAALKSTTINLILDFNAPKDCLVWLEFKKINHKNDFPLKQCVCISTKLKRYSSVDTRVSGANTKVSGADKKSDMVLIEKCQAVIHTCFMTLIIKCHALLHTGYALILIFTCYMVLIHTWDLTMIQVVTLLTLDDSRKHGLIRYIWLELVFLLHLKI